MAERANRLHNLGQVCVLLISIHISCCYNLDTRSPVIRHGDDGTFFGFSVAIHSVGDDDVLMVGAPRGDSGLSQTTGALYRCPVLPLNSTMNCQKISQEIQEPTRNKTDQWLGATVRSSGADGTVLTCAPFSKELRAASGVHPSGKCIFYTNNFANKNDVAPCRPTDDVIKSPFSGLTHCLAGISAEQTGDDLVIGGPGSYAAQGSIFTLNDNGNYINPNEEPSSSDGNYQGYSMAFGNFSDSADMDIITGVPRGNVLLGLVRIYNKNLVLIKEIAGSQVGSHYGGSVVGSDLNGDGFDDLVVGASNYWNRETNQIDVGQVYIYYQTSLGNFDVEDTVITGQYERGRFGFVVSALGDINDDGVNDLAISAPYEENGAVYIYNGRKGDKIKTMPSQVLRPSDFNVPMERFGFALSANRDADKNLYPDLLVGSYQSDTVVLIRTKPVIRPFITVTFDSVRVNLTGRNVVWGGRLVSGFGGQVCMNYTGLGTDDSYVFNIILTMEAEKQISRAEFYTDATTSMRVLRYNDTRFHKATKLQCENFYAFLKDQLVDKVSPITISVSTDVVQDIDSLPPGTIPHVLDVYTNSKDAQIPIFFDCLNPACSPNLITSVKSDKPILFFGDNTEVVLTVTVRNTADEAFGAHLYALLPDEAKFLSFRTTKSDLSIVCEIMHQVKSVVCDIGNPLPRTTDIVFELNLQISPVPGDRTHLPMVLIANSTSEEAADTQGDNRVTLRWELQPKVGILLDGSTNIEQVIYNDTDVALKLTETNDTDSIQKADEVIHTYWVQNLGPATISLARLEVSWPMKTLNGRQLLSLKRVNINNGQECITEDLENMQDEATISKEESRERRSVSEAVKEDGDSGVPSKIVVDCSKGHSGCVKISCNLSNIDNDGTNIILTIESRLMLESLLKDNEPAEWEITSMARLTVQSIPYITQPTKTPEEVKTLSLRTIPLTFLDTTPIPLWVIIVSVVVGSLFLVILILILYKCGFFQRNKIDLEEFKRSYEGQRESDNEDMLIDDATTIE